MSRDVQRAKHKERCERDAPTLVPYLLSYLNGGVSGLITTIITFPVYKTVFRQQLNSTRVRQTVAQLYNEGILKLYRGVAPPLLMKTLQTTVLFGLQDTLLQQLSPWAGPLVPGSMLPAVAGLGTGVVEALIFNPFERVQCILQNNNNYQNLPTTSKIMARLKSEPLAYGWYRGFLPTLFRNAVGTSLYFGMKDPVSNALNEQRFPRFVSSFLSGMISSLVISLPLYPVSVLVANMQAQVGERNPGLRASWNQLWENKQKSLVQLYRGGSLVILRSCVTWGITAFIYDLLTRHTH